MKNSIKIQNALWGLFISDPISMPVHWYYKREYIKNGFGAIDGYKKASHLYPESFMVGDAYYLDVEMAKKLDSPFDMILDTLAYASS